MELVEERSREAEKLAGETALSTRLRVVPAAPGPALRKGKCKATAPSFPKLGPLPWGVWVLKGQECVGAAAGGRAETAPSGRVG